MNIYKLISFLGLFTMLILNACGSTLSYSPTSRYSEGDLRSINDEDIQKAFEAEPQLVFPVNIAWYNMSRDSLANHLHITGDSLVSSNYEIPKSLVEGFIPLFESQPQKIYYRNQPINFKGVRMLAARAKCDLVILVSSRFAEDRNLNSWATLNVLLLPALFTPYLNIDYRYSAEVFIFDVRNGYMYKHLTFNDEASVNHVTVWSTDHLAETNNQNMLNKAKEFMRSEISHYFNAKASEVKE